MIGIKIANYTQKVSNLYLINMRFYQSFLTNSGVGSRKMYEERNVMSQLPTKLVVSDYCKLCYTFHYNRCEVKTSWKLS